MREMRDECDATKKKGGWDKKRPEEEMLPNSGVLLTHP